MSKCIKCGSYAFNLYKEDIDQGGLCDVHYWQGKAHRAEAMSVIKQDLTPEHPAQGCDYCTHPLYAGIKCPNCGRKQPAQRTWVGLTDEEVDEWTPEIHTVIRAIEAKLRSKNEDRN